MTFTDFFLTNYFSACIINTVSLSYTLKAEKIKSMKRLICILLTAIMLLSFVCCSGSSNTQTDTAENSGEGTTATEIPEDDKKEVFVYTEGSIRVQLYSDTLLRVEEALDGKFEDRASFVVVNRTNFDGVDATAEKSNGKITIKTDTYTVSMPENAESVKDVTVTGNDGHELWEYTSKLSNTRYLPDPGDTPEVWAFNDCPRLIPSENAFDSNGEENNGWEYSKDARDYFIFISDHDSKQLRKDFVELTGSTELLPLKSLGLWFSRFYAYSSSDILSHIKSFRDHGYPIDYFVVDTDWKKGASTGYEVNTDLFRDMEGFITSAHRLNVNIVMNDHVRDCSDTVLSSNQLTWFGENLTAKLNMGLDSWWYDRNWVYSLNSPYKEYSGDLLGQAMYLYFTDKVNGNNRTMLLSNIYWDYSGTLTGKPNLSAHRFSIQWTGDIKSELSSLENELKNAVYIGAKSSVSYISSDIGGHLGNPGEDDFIRWTQYGALSSIMRYHSSGADRTPWVVGDTANEVAKKYINMRYRLLPLYYMLAYETYENGMPIMKRLDFEYPQYDESKDNTQYMLGDGIIVAPIYTGRQEIVPTKWLTHGDGKSGLYAEYYDNSTLSGEPKVTKTDSKINFELTTGAFDNSVGADNFSVRWTGKITPKYDCNLAMLGDDGIRVYIDGELIIDCWKAADGVITKNEEFVLKAGKSYDIKVEYFELTGNAAAQLYYIVDGVDTDSREVFIPDGEWIDVWTGKVYTGPQTYTVSHGIETSPIFVKKGSVIPLADTYDYADVSQWEKLKLDVYLGDDFETYLYEDDGKTDDYKSGKYRTTPITMKSEGSKTLVTVGAATGEYKSKYDKREVTLRIHTFGKSVSGVTVNGESVTFKTVKQSVDSVPFAAEGAALDSDIVTFTVNAEIDSETVITIE